MSNGQEEHMGYKYGLIGVILNAIESLQVQGLLGGAALSPADAANFCLDLAKKMQLLVNDRDAKERLTTQNVQNAPWYKMLCHVFGECQMPGTQGLNDSRVHRAARNREEFKTYNALTRNCMRVLCSGVAASWFHNSSRILGRAMNRCRPTETLHGIFGHSKRI
jgi:hypothetical protein